MPAFLLIGALLGVDFGGLTLVKASAKTESHAVDMEHLKRVDSLIDNAIGQGRCPGAVLEVGNGDDIIYRKSYGYRAIEPERIVETADTLFDLASLTKVVATTPSIMILSDSGLLNVTDKAAKYLPEFAANGKQDITIEQLLLHCSGLIPDNPIADYQNGPVEAWKNICALKPEWTPGTHFAYSDVNFIVLGKVVEAISKVPLDEYAQQHLFKPLGMAHTRFKPPESWRTLCAPTEQRAGHWMIGEVHDPRSFALGGVAGHAGLFSTSDDISRYCRMLLHGGALDGVRVLKESTVRQMIEPRDLPGKAGSRGYGFDIDTAYSRARGNRFEAGSTFGHTGFTGTMFWIDPVHQCFIVLLTNAVHPNGNGNVLRLRYDVATVVAEALLGPKPGEVPPSTQPQTRPNFQPVRTGIDVLEQEHYRPVHGKRIALITNRTGVNGAGMRTIDLLFAAPDVHLTEVFSPEHGLAGAADSKVSDSVDSATGLKVISLYGDNRKPTPTMLTDIDALVYDIQDVGARYYTFESTMGLCMEAAAARKIPIYVLDRPNPNTGLIVDGPLADENKLGFIAYAPVPVSHGMTVGELARFFNDERGIRCDLNVVQMQGWHRSMWWDDTGLAWVNPSPNIRNPTQALLYLGIGLLETENVSVGRGTDQPFEMFGAPWIDERKLAEALNDAELPGLRFVPITFTPESSIFAGQQCKGCYIQIVDRRSVQPVRSGLTIAWQLKKLFGGTFEVRQMQHILCNDATLQMLITTENPKRLVDSWSKPLETFKQLREKYLLYPQ